MDIYFTFDYELFFGSKSGSAQRCLLEPTHELIQIADKSNASFAFFVDAGYLLKLNECRNKFTSLEKDYSEISRQLEVLVKKGHDLQLHIHPHWQDSFYDGEKWIMSTKRYKISDFSDKEANVIFESYYNELKKHCPPLIAYRAGGWCIQPFEKFKLSFKKFGIIYDSSVYKGGSRFSEQYNFDFTDAPSKTSWRFEDDPLKEQSDGSFTEFAMNARMYSPMFFWKLFLLGRISPGIHKYTGDGSALSVPGYRKKILTQPTLQCTNADGYYASQIEFDLHKAISRNTGNEFVILGHPKAMTRYSLGKLEEIIPTLQKSNTLMSFSKFHSTNGLR